MTTVVVNRQGQLSIRLNRTNSGALTQAHDSVSVTQATSTNQTRLRDLLDVDASAASDGDTVIYNVDTDKYEVREISVDDINLDDIDGGTF